MATIKHTPGPWVIKTPGTIVGHSNKCVIKNDDYFDWVAIVQSANVPEWESNAKLIAAAPELLQALEKLRAAFIKAVGDESTFAKWALSTVDIAINKATQP